MPSQYDHEYPPNEWTADGISRTLRSTEESYPIPSYDDTETWEAIRSNDLTGPIAETILEAAEEACDEPIPQLPASLYLDYERTGNRGGYQEPKQRQLVRLSLFSLAECLEREGRYLDRVLDYAWAICEQSTWVLPAHLPDDGTVGLEGLPLPTQPAENHIALHPAEMGKELAELDYLLGDQLHPALRERIRTEIEVRVIAPYEARDDFGWLDPPTNNWNAVCNAGAVIAALHVLDDVDRIGQLVAKAATSLQHYLADFDPNGCTAEGIGYWNYGFGNYVQVASHLAERTDGEYDLMSVPIVEAIATYPLNVELSPGHYVPFSDAREETWPAPYTVFCLGERFDLPALVARGCEALSTRSVLEQKGDTNLRTLAWGVRSDADSEPAFKHPRQRFLSGYDWWFARTVPEAPDGLVVAVKGGHNGESHNHNDCGSFVFHRNRESLLTDLGRPTYTDSYFGDRRYEHLATRSLGHSVPYVNGYEQASGTDRSATVIDRTETDVTDSITLELAECYPEDTGVERLERTVELDRANKQVQITDEASFEDEGSFESILVAYRPMVVADGAIEIEGQRGSATVTPEKSAAVEVERLENAIDTSGHEKRTNEMADVWRGRVETDRDEDVDLTLDVTF